MTEKESILALLGQKDLSTLQKLVNYSDLFIIPEDDLCVNVTMSQMVNKAHSLADRYFPEWTDRSKSDFGEFLVELIALFSEKDFWYINAFANESLIRKTRSYSNTFVKSAQLGYKPNLGKGAKISLSITVPAGGSFTYDIGTIIVELNGKEYLNLEPIVVSTTSISTVTATFIEGSYKKEDVLFNGSNVLISKQNIDVDTVRVFIEGVEFTKVNNFGESVSDSNHFVVLPEDSGYVSIFFGSNGYGSEVLLGTAIHVEYVETSGVVLNTTGDVSVRVSPNVRPVTSASYVSNIVDGGIIEDINSIKEKAPLYFGHRNSGINVPLTENILKGFDFILKAKANVFYRNVEYSCIPKDGSDNLTVDEQSFLASNFHPLLMLGYNGIYRNNNYIDLIGASGTTSIALEVYISKGYDTLAATEVVKQVITDYTSPLILAEYGKGFSKSTVDSLIKAKGYGVQNIIWKKADNSILPDLSIGEFDIFKPIDLTKVNISIYVS